MNVFSMCKRGLRLTDDQGRYSLGAAQFGNVEFVRKAHAANPGDTLIIWRDTGELIYRHYIDQDGGLERELMLHDDVIHLPNGTTLVRVGVGRRGGYRDEYRIPAIGGGYHVLPPGREWAKAEVIAQAKKEWGNDIKVEIVPL